ncbi:GspE/PulE family protein [Morganella psychrotolerans]|uniref:GspE/PulE family protein n=1 Tax=Morganella psychrotolerans TaxID=368603 RepID=UPI0039B10621
MIEIIQPDTDISRFVRVSQTDEGFLEIYVAENQKTDLKVQNYVTRMQKVNSSQIKICFVSLDQIREKEQIDVATGRSQNQQKVMDYFRKANALNASDLHFTIGRDGGDYCYIEARVHGELQVIDCIDKASGLELASTICLSMCDVTEKQFYPNQHQDGRIAEEFVKSLGIFGARYAHMPAVGGLYAVMRLIKDDSGKPPTMEELGFLPEQVKVFKRLLRRPDGMIILSGPTGSGKSTTLRSASAMYLHLGKNSEQLPTKRLLTIEDPPEGRIEGAIQTPIIADKKVIEDLVRAWSLSMVYAMRCDPDAILNGEIRDSESAKTAVKAALTGHLLLATLHANDALNIIERLETEGVNSRLIADPKLLIGLISQRLVQKLCPECKKSWTNSKTEFEEDDIKLVDKYCKTESVYIRNIKGCSHCKNGVTGRIVVAEIIAPDATFFELYRTKSKLVARSYWHYRLGGITRNQHVLHYINNGLVDPLAAHVICPLDEDSYSLLKENEFNV